MANKGIGYFDSKRQFFRTPEEATVSDLASILGRVGEGESLAPGIAKMILDKRFEIERVLAEYDAMMRDHEDMIARLEKPEPGDSPDNVTPFRTAG